MAMFYTFQMLDEKDFIYSLTVQGLADAVRASARFVMVGRRKGAVAVNKKKRELAEKFHSCIVTRKVHHHTTSSPEGLGFLNVILKN
jgi:hypothetical protein